MDGSPVHIDFLRAHSADGLAGTDETQSAFYPPSDGDGPNELTAKGLHDW